MQLWHTATVVCKQRRSTVSSQASFLWESVVMSASELEAFEPGLAGLSAELNNIDNGREFSNAWLNKAMPHLKSETVLGLAFQLNELAGVYFADGNVQKARSAALSALVLYAINLGAEHPDTKLIASNLKKLQSALSESK